MVSVLVCYNNIFYFVLRETNNTFLSLHLSVGHYIFGENNSVDKLRHLM